MNNGVDNKELAKKAMSIKGKQYVQVKDRILALAQSDVPYEIETEYQYFESRNMWVVKAKLTVNGQLYTGLAQEVESDNFKEVNYTSALENAETSAVGRACAFAGIGIVDSIASVDEINKANFRSERRQYDQEETMWYNDTDKNIKKWGEMVRNGETTPDAIIKKIESEGYRLANKHKQSIQSLGEKDLTNPPF